MSEKELFGIDYLKNTVSRFPDKPGVYIMKDEDETIIYVGKAKIIRNRVKSYFNSNKDIKTTMLMRKVTSIEHITTSTEFEALLLENTLIKKWTPRYNIRLKDGKSYPVIRITNEDFPRVFKTRRIIKDGSVYYGPFPNVGHIDIYLELIEKLFPLRKCKGKLKKRKNPCLYYHIGRCLSPCTGNVTKEEYRKNIRKIKILLSGKTKKIKKELHDTMMKYAEKLNFEKAAEYRNIIEAFKQLEEDSTIVDFDIETRDYISYVCEDNICSYSVFQMREGKLIGRDIIRTEIYTEEKEGFTQFILQYYQDFNALPSKIYVDAEVEKEIIETFFKDKSSKKIEILHPETKSHFSVLNMVKENAREDLEKQKWERGNIQALEALQQSLGLPRLPRRIEGFDIAHIGGEKPVASMVSFLNGIPEKSKYRKYHMKSLKGEIDDFKAIREVVARRYTRILNDNLPKPDLILVDGGKGQVSSAYSILEALELHDKIPLAGLAKKEEHVFVPHQTEPIIIKEGSPALRVLQNVRDESHRFATTFNKSLIQKRDTSSQLEQIPGIGKKRSKMLLTHFGSLDNLKDKSPEEIAKTAKIKIELAEAIIEFIRKKK